MEIHARVAGDSCQPHDEGCSGVEVCLSQYLLHSLSRCQVTLAWMIHNYTTKLTNDVKAVFYTGVGRYKLNSECSIFVRLPLGGWRGAQPKHDELPTLHPVDMPYMI